MIPLPPPPEGREQPNRSHPQKPRPSRCPPSPPPPTSGRGGGEIPREHTQRTTSTAPERTRPSEGWGSGRGAVQGIRLPKKPRRRVERPETHREGRSLKGETTAPTKGRQVKTSHHVTDQSIQCYKERSFGQQS